MAIEALILAQNGTGWRKKGYIIYERDYPFTWGSKEVPPLFMRCIITGDLTVEQARAYRDQWTLTFDWSVESNDPVLDERDVRISASPVNVSGEGQLTWDKIDQFMTPMNITLDSQDATGVLVNYRIYEVATSPWFWGVASVVGISFDEISYDQGTGVHRIEADYSVAGFVPAKVEKRVLDNGGVIVTHAANVITFDINRSDVNTKAKEWFDQMVENKQEERRFYVNGSYVDQVMAGTYPGQSYESKTGAELQGYDTRTKAEFLALIEDRINE